jgi:hypothetical protein
MRYLEQLQTFEWRIKAIEIKIRDDHECQICGKTKDLHVHHVVYLPNLMAWQYPSNYYITLCETCHLYEHSIIDNRIDEIKELLLSGMMGIDIFKKFKSNEKLIDVIPF